MNSEARIWTEITCTSATMQYPAYMFENKSELLSYEILFLLMQNGNNFMQSAM